MREVRDMIGRRVRRIERFEYAWRDFSRRARSY